MKKKLYYLFEDDEDNSLTTADIYEIINIIQADLHGISEKDELGKYTITPIWLTEEEFANLPEMDF